ncbi:helix-turn-helix domain-containing protein [Novosphingobium sp. G106]|nr:helix-turn-helix domain-containing protein [Novosphingobium sp. G106]
MSISDRLGDQEFRREWFRAELEEAVPSAFLALRERRQMTQTELAKLMGTKQPAISRFEKSTEPVWEFDFLLRLAEALDARLRVVVEASEDIIEEYKDHPKETAAAAAVSTAHSSAAYALVQSQPAFSGPSLRYPNGINQYRAGQDNSAGELSFYPRQSVFSGPPERFGNSIPVSIPTRSIP